MIFALGNTKTTLLWECAGFWGLCLHCSRHWAWIADGPAKVSDSVGCSGSPVRSRPTSAVREATEMAITAAPERKQTTARPVPLNCSCPSNLPRMIGYGSPLPSIPSLCDLQRPVDSRGPSPRTDWSRKSSRGRRTDCSNWPVDFLVPGCGS